MQILPPTNGADEGPQIVQGPQILLEGCSLYSCGLKDLSASSTIWDPGTSWGPKVARFVGRDKSIYLPRKYLGNQNCPNTYLVVAITGVANGFGWRPEV